MHEKVVSNGGQRSVLIFGAADLLLQAVVNQMKRQFPQGSKFLVVGNKLDIGLTNLVRMEQRTIAMKELLREDHFSGKEIELKSSSTFNQARLTGLDHLERKSASFVWRHHRLRSLDDSKHYYHIIVDLLSNYLVQNQINLILFFEIPHLFVDTLAYQIARARNIDILILSPAIYPNWFFSLRKMPDHGVWSTSSTNRFTDVSLLIEGTKDWTYMRGTEQHRGELGSLNWQGMLMLLVHLATVKPSNLLKPMYIWRMLERMNRISSRLPKWRYPFSKYFATHHLNFFEMLSEFELTEIDLNRKFVYFPLQLQPEMTTSSLGGIYSDQLLALEKLAQMLPDDCLIYVKENPKQGGQMRGAQFFRRLNGMKMIHCLPSYANTFQLIEKSQFVATITGTAAWEAICRGKKALIFGSVWFQQLPGIFKFQEGMTYEGICNYTIDQDELRRQINQLFARVHTGNIKPLKRRIFKGCSDLDANAKLVANTIVELIENRIETTFTS